MTSSARARILRIIEEFGAGAFDVERLQDRLSAEAATVDNSERQILDAMRTVDTDLERIRFGMPVNDQPAAARDCLLGLRELIERGE